jgi:hypothetical protein
MLMMCHKQYTHLLNLLSTQHQETSKYWIYVAPQVTNVDQVNSKKGGHLSKDID